MGWVPWSWVSATGAFGAAVAHCVMAVPCQLCSLASVNGAIQCTDGCRLSQSRVACSRIHMPLIFLSKMSLSKMFLSQMFFSKMYSAR